MMWRHDSWGWGDWFGPAIMMVLFWVLVIAAVFLLARWLGNAGRAGHTGKVGPYHAPSPPAEHAPGRTQAEDILAERFARGEIDEEEFHRRLESLRKSRSAG